MNVSDEVLCISLTLRGVVKCLSLLVFFSSMACSMNPPYPREVYSGGPLELVLNQVIVDQLAPPEDISDWKEMDFPGPGLVTLQIYLEKVAMDAQGSFEFVSSTGEPIFSTPLKPGELKRTLPITEAGTYYLHISTVGGGFQYALRVDFEALQ